MHVIALDSEHREWSESLVAEHFGSTRIVSHGRLHELAELPGLVALDEDEHPFGVVYYRLEDDSCEVVAIVALEPGHHVGKTLMLALGELACSRGCSRIWLVTTNDNLGAQAFYAALGFDLVDVREDAIVQARVLKPEIPLLGHNGVPIRDELEFEVSLPGELSC